MDSSLSDRVRRLAEDARARAKPATTDQIASRQECRAWWRITKPAGETVDVFFHPPQPLTRVLEWYPGAGALPIG